MRRINEKIQKELELESCGFTPKLSRKIDKASKGKGGHAVLLAPLEVKAISNWSGIEENGWFMWKRTQIVLSGNKIFRL
jgi:hypothetical protein